jgi:hypothetical protein
MSQQSTADQVVRYLEHHCNANVKDRDDIRCCSPLRPASNNKTAFSLKITSPEHGTWQDFVSGESGSLYELAQKLGIPLPKGKHMTHNSNAQQTSEHVSH